MEIINVSDEIIEINVTEEVVNIVTQTGAYPLPSNVFSVFGRVGNVVGQAGDYTTSLVGEGTNLYFTNARSRASISENITGINYDSASGIFSMASGYVIPTQVMLDAKQDDLNGTGIVKSTGGTITYLTDNTANWDAAYNDKINSASVTGTSTKTLTLNQQDGGTITASWSDADTGLTSVGLSMPAAFSVSGSPLTSNGTISVTGSGTTAQYVRGDGTLATFPTIANEAQRLITEVYNKTGATLTKGTIVYINGGQGNLPSITKAIATGDATSAQTYGVVQNDITNNNNGYVVVVGSILNIDTQAYADGTQLYLSGTIAGQFTSTKPYAPIHLVYVGIVTRSHPTQGVIEVRIQNGYEMDELHNVAAQSPNDGDILKYVSSTSLWTKTAGNTTNISEGTNLYYTQARFDTAFGNKSTTNLTEGTNLYYTAARFNTAFSGKTTTDLAEGTNLYYTDGRARAAITGTLPISVTSGVVSISQAGGASNGFLTSTDWNTFNNKQAALSGTGFVKSTAGVISYDTNTYLTTISGIAAGGELSGTYANPSLVNSAVTGKVLTGLNLVGGGTIADTDSILGAFGKVQNQISALVGGVMYEGTWNASTNTPTITSSVGSKGDYYIVATAGSTNINGITSWNVGDWIIFNGSTWDKVDNTDAVSSVNGYTGAVSLVTSDVPESGSLYFTNARAIGSTLTGYTSGAGVVAATDSILQAIQKLNGNVSGLVTGVSSVFGRTGAVVAASGDYTTTQVTEGTNLYYTDSRFNTAFSAKSTTDLTEGTNLYYTEARVNANTNVAANTAARHAAVTIGTANGLSLSTQALSLAAASTSTTGALTSTDWNTFNNKQNALTNPVTGTGAGTTNTLPKFTGSNAIGNSLFSDNGTNGAFGGANYSAGTGVRTFNITAPQFAGIAFWTSSGYSADIFSYESTGNLIINADPNNTISASNLFLAVDGTTIATLNTTNVTLSRALSGTSATFSGAFEAGKTGGAVTAGDLFVDPTSLASKVIVGRLSSTGSDNTTFIVRNRIGTQGVTMDGFGNANFLATITSQVNNILADGVGVVLQGYVDNTLRIAVRGSGYNSGARGNLLANSGDFSNNVTSPQFRITPSGTFRVNTNDDAILGYMIRSGTWKGTTENNLALATDGPYGIAFYTNGSGNERVLITTDGNQINYGNIFLNQTSVATINANSTSIGINGIYYMNRGSGSGLSHVILGNGGNVIGSISSNTTNAQFNTSSDYRLKEDLKDFNALNILSNIKLYDFAWKLNNSRMYGVMAHELKEVLPYAVVGEKDEIDEDGNIKSQGVDYSLLTPILAKAIQELEARIKELENK